MAVLAAATSLAWPALAMAQEQEPDPQPGIDWTEEEIFQAVSTARAGRKLTPPSWPDGARVAVCLSFDVDNETLSLPEGDTEPVTLSAGEYGAMTALPRILDLLDRHDLPASFYVPAVAAMLHPQMLEEITKRPRHEVGVHGWIHEDLAVLDDPEKEQRFLDQSIDYLTRMTGKRPVGFRSPSWIFSKYTLSQIQKAGFLYDSSMMAMDEPYELLANGEKTGLIELPVDWILDDYPYFGPWASGSLPSAEQMMRVYQDEFEGAYEEGTMLMLTFHPHIIGHRSRIRHLERLVSYMESKPGVWFATAEQIAKYVKQQSLESQ
jgi:peptidoglycan/xylan/chitin deacetylase (PgdA/CDA1 family)